MMSKRTVRELERIRDQIRGELTEAEAVLAQAQRRYDELLRSADEVMRVMQMVDSMAYADGDDEVGFIGEDGLPHNTKAGVIE